MIAPVNGKISKDTTKPTAIPTRMVMSIEGAVLARTVMKYVRETVAPEKIDVVIDEEAINRAGVTLDRRVNVAAKNMAPGDLLLTTLNPLGLTYRYDADRMLVGIVPAK